MAPQKPIQADHGLQESVGCGFRVLPGQAADCAVGLFDEIIQITIQCVMIGV